MSDSLHDDGGLHQFKEMYAELEDGRTVKVAIGEDGHLEIIGFLPGTDPTPDVDKTLKPAPQNTVATINLIPPPYAVAEPQQQAAPQQPQSPVGPAQNIPQGAVTVDYQSMTLVAMRQMLNVSTYYGQGVGSSSADKKGSNDEITKMERDPVFQARLSNIMNDNQFDRRLRGRTRGKLDMTRLYKAQTGSKSVFTQKMSRRNKKYNIVLVVDQSGSMFNIGGGGPDNIQVISPASRIAIAGDVAQFLAQHLDRIPGVELMIVGFSDTSKVHKAFDKSVDLDKIRSKVLGYGGSGTNDWSGLNAAYNALKKQGEGQNIVLFLTDGDSNDEAGTKRLIKHNDHLATTIAVGIEMVPKQTKKRIVVENVATLKPAVIGLLEKEIKRG